MQLHGYPAGSDHYTPTQDGDDRMRRYYGFGGAAIIVSAAAAANYASAGVTVEALCRADRDTVSDDVWYSRLFGDAVLRTPSVGSAGTTQRNIDVAMELGISLPPATRRLEAAATTTPLPPMRGIADCDPRLLSFASTTDVCLSNRDWVGMDACRPPIFRPSGIHMGNEAPNMARIDLLHRVLGEDAWRAVISQDGDRHLYKWALCLLPRHIAQQLAATGSPTSMGSTSPVIPMLPPLSEDGSIAAAAAARREALQRGAGSPGAQPFSFLDARAWDAARTKARQTCRLRRLVVAVSHEASALMLQALLEELYDLVDHFVVVEGHITLPSLADQAQERRREAAALSASRPHDVAGIAAAVSPNTTFASLAWTPAFGRFAPKMRVVTMPPADLAGGWGVGTVPLPPPDAPWYAAYGVNTAARWRRALWEAADALRSAAARFPAKGVLGVRHATGADTATGGIAEPVIIFVRSTDVLSRDFVHTLRYLCGAESGSTDRAVRDALATPRSLQLPLFDLSLRRRVPDVAPGSSDAVMGALATVFITTLSQAAKLVGERPVKWGGSMSTFLEAATPWPTELLPELATGVRARGVACPLCGGVAAVAVVMERYRRDVTGSIDARGLTESALAAEGSLTCAASLTAPPPPAAEPCGAVQVIPEEACHWTADCAVGADGGAGPVPIPEMPETVRWRPFAYHFLMDPLIVHEGIKYTGW